jgi:glucose-1-phosphate thymidylyltransferase
MILWKGIILAGGSGTRLHPLTKTISKQTLPVCNKPMINYPLSTLMMADMRNVLIISNPHDPPLCQPLLGDGLTASLKIATARTRVSKVFGYHVHDPKRYEMMSIDAHGRAIEIVEKPKEPKSNYAAPVLYFYDNDVLQIAKNLKPSAHGELEITDVNKEFLKRERLHVEVLGRGIARLDTSTRESRLQSSTIIETVENRQVLKISRPEESEFHKDWITAAQVEETARGMKNSKSRAV